MRLKIQRLRIAAQTGEGPFGLDLELSDGLTIVRADNSMGKSTVTNAILYALGGEGMLGPRWPKVLKYCLYEYLETDQGKKHRVLESSITVECANDRDETLSIRRFVASEDVSADLVQLWNGRVLSDPEHAQRRGDAFLRTGGSATRPDGFHRQLTDFVGWNLPDVTRYDGASSPLYLQLLFPFFFVEQQVGWSGVQANIPRFLQVRDPGHRAVEFLLSLDANERSQRREHLRVRESKIRQEWSESIAEFRGSTQGEAFRLRDLPETPITSWPPSPPPVVEVFDDGEWGTLDAVAYSLRGRLRELKEREIPTVKAVAAETEKQLATLEAEHHQLAAAHAVLVHDVEADAADLERLDARLESLRVDRLRHQDAEKIVQLGGSPARELEDGRCPTCDQNWPVALLGGSEVGEPVMTVAEHLQLINQESQSLKTLRKGAGAVLQDRRTREQALREKLVEIRADIRAHRQTLISDANGPSAAAIREQLLVEDKINHLDRMRLELARLLEGLEAHVEGYREVRAELLELADSDLSEADKKRLDEFRDHFLSQLDEYGFRSMDGVTLSEDTYLPERKGFDLTHEVSASDTIRLIWAYLVGLMETGEAGETNHPGLLVLDEPGQQEIEDASLRAFLAHAATFRDRHQQIIATITRPLSQFASDALETATVHDFGSKRHVLQPLDR
jgi:hypothetical protein